MHLAMLLDSQQLLQKSCLLLNLKKPAYCRAVLCLLITMKGTIHHSAHGL